MTAPFSVRSLGPEHDRSAFSCGVDALDRYFRERVSQDIRRRVATCFVALPAEDPVIAGYYTLAAGSIPMAELPEADARRLPRYPVLPAALIGRLAVDRRYRNQGLGAALLFDAIMRVARAEAAVFAIIVDAKGDDALRFYERFGFTSFASRPMSLFLPVATAVKLLG